MGHGQGDKTPRRNLSMPDGTNGNDSNSSRIQVVVRVRPENAQERDGGYKLVVRTLGDQMLVFDPKDEGSPGFYQGKRRRGRDMMKRKNRDIRFAFDHVLDEDASNEDIFAGTIKDVLDGLLDGYNCSVFAYGATGAGKTFTMLGSPTHPGVMFLTMVALYNRINAMKDEKTCEIAVSYLEVYNEQIRDLLLNSGTLPVREDPDKGVIVTGLSLHKLNSAEELFHMLQLGNKNRTQHPTDANAESSRSHAVFQVFVRQKDRTASLSTEVRVAKMSLIDLAGSERATVTTNRGDRFREGANINKSLLALGNCINALAEGKEKAYVPYRNSKLTRLLKDSLGGNCRTVMIAAISPSAMSYEDTYNTLKYADRAKNIKATLKRNVVSVDLHITKYAKIVDELRIEVTELKGKLRQYEEGSALNPGQMLPGFDIPSLQLTLDAVFQERVNIRKELMELEASDRDLSAKIHYKEIRLNRIKLINSGSDVEEKSEAAVSRVHAMKSRQAGIQKRKERISERMNSNEGRLGQVEADMRTIRPDGRLPEILEQQLQKRHLEIELRDVRRSNKFLRKFSRGQKREAQATEKMLCNLLQIVKHQYFILKGQGLASSDVTAEFESIRQMVDGDREVAWADQSVVAETSVMDPQTMGRSSSTASLTQVSAGFDINEVVSFPTVQCVLTPIIQTPRAKPRICRTPGKMGGTPRPRTPHGGHPNPLQNGGIPTPCRDPPSQPNFGDCTSPTSASECDSVRIVNTPQPNQRVLAEAISSTVQDRLDMSLASAQSAESLPTPCANHHQSGDSKWEDGAAKSCVVNAGRTPFAKMACHSFDPVESNEDFQPLEHPPNCDSNVASSLHVPKIKLHTVPPHQIDHTFTLAESQPLEHPPNCDSNVENCAASLHVTKIKPPAIPSHQIDQTFTLVEGVFPLQPSPEDCNNKTQSRVQDQDLPNSNTNSNTETAHIHPHHVDVNHKSDSLQPSSSISQMTQTPKRNSQVKDHIGDQRTHVTSQKKVNSATVTKSRQQPTSATRGLSTVTKSRPVDHNSHDKENEVPLKNRHLQVVRSMDFATPSCPSPGQYVKSFADAVKSPVMRNPCPEATRSPLASRENLPLDPIDTAERKPKVDDRRMSIAPQSRRSGVSGIPRQKLFSSSSSSQLGMNTMSQEITAQPANRGALSHASEIVQRFGLPSVLETVKGHFTGVAGGGHKTSHPPSYMQMTKSASRRHRYHRRSVSAETSSTAHQEFSAGENFVRRIKTTGTLKQPARVFGRSKSSAQMLKKSTFF